MTDYPEELSDKTHCLIVELCVEGDRLAGEAKYDEAVVEYKKAWKLIPEPKASWEASTWILAAIADACFLMGKNIPARKALEYAMTCPGAIDNPFLHLRLGQVLYNEGDRELAVDELMRAYMGGGTEIFGKDNPVYFDFLKSKIDL